MVVATRTHVRIADEDLAWARALAAGERTALDRYERELVPVITKQLRRRGTRDDVIDEVQQALRARLLVGDGNGPAIAGYEGRGPLRAWVMVAAFREAVRVRHRARREPIAEVDALGALADHSTFSTGIDEHYRDAFRCAFRSALRKLTPRDRGVLRMSAIDGMSIDEIGTLHGVHRATAARWVHHARVALARNVRRDLMMLIGSNEDVCRDSRIEVTLSGLRD